MANIHEPDAIERVTRPNVFIARHIYIAAPHDEAGGGMGRVKDYILRCAPDRDGRFVLRPLITRDMRGAFFSLALLFGCITTICLQRLRGRIALLHVNMGDRGSLFRKGLLILTARIVGVKTLLHLHAVELDRHFAKAGPVLRWLIRLPFRQATSIAVLGERFRDWLVDEVGIDSARIDILYNGVDVGDPPDRKTRGPDEPLVILFLGNMIERKGLSDLIAALALIPAGTRPWRAMVAGGGDPAPYRRQAEALHIADRIAFSGWVDQAGVRALLAEVDVLVLPSYDEGLPLVILEALAMAVPVLCTPVGVIGEVLTDGETAAFTPVGDRQALSEKLTGLLTDDALRERLSRDGHALFRRCFSLEAFQSALLVIYRRRYGIDYRREGADDAAA
jgi:glycosyltransferase involved in cell wall biosynthesis